MFNYVDANLGSYDELKNLSYVFTYTEDTLDPITGLTSSVSYPVTVTTPTPHPTISVSGNTISGYYDGAFSYGIDYINKSDQHVHTDNFNKIVDKRDLYDYTPSLEITKAYTYTAKAMDGNTMVASQDFTITLTNNWTYGRNQLLKYTMPDRYQKQITVTWVSSTGQVIPMLDKYGNQITWENNS